MTLWRDGFQRVLFAPCRKLRRDNPSKILVNLCVALAVSNLVFVAGMHPYALNNVVGCKVSTEVCGMVLKCAVGVHPLPTVTCDVSWTLLDPPLYRLQFLLCKSFSFRLILRFGGRLNCGSVVYGSAIMGTAICRWWCSYHFLIPVRKIFVGLYFALEVSTCMPENISDTHSKNLCRPIFCTWSCLHVRKHFAQEHCTHQLCCVRVRNTRVICRLLQQWVPRKHELRSSLLNIQSCQKHSAFFWSRSE